jgi:hypothetical protein
MASTISAQDSLSVNLQKLSDQTLDADAQARLGSAQKLSITPASQADSAVLLSLSGATPYSPDLSFRSLIYNASAALSGTTGEALATSESTEAKIQSLIATYGS